MTKSYKLAESITSFRQDKTLADIVQKVDDEAFQDYPFLKALVDKSNYLNQNNWQQNMEFITDMLPLFGKLSTLECFVGLPHYFADTYQAIKNWQANKPKPIRVPWFNPPQQHADKVQKLYNVTFDLETSIKNCRIFGNAISEGRGLYAFIGPKIEKWKREFQNGRIAFLGLCFSSFHP